MPRPPPSQEEPTMLYVPKTEKLWDCWMYHRDGLFYLYYLRISAKGSWWDGISLAISKDLIHWDYVGPVIEKSDAAKWMGTGMVWKNGDRYLMNFSEEHPEKQQKVYFAESYDLISWRRLDVVCEPDGSHFLFDFAKSPNPYPRWDSLGVFETSEHPGRLHAFVTASFDHPEAPARNGALGFLKVGTGCIGKRFPAHWRSLANIPIMKSWSTWRSTVGIMRIFRPIPKPESDMKT
ncbi:MAG: hypothetical protein MZU97_08520 [Bacillus subtilis]|nr:hypothetical protein [Bacillus subtilis]